MAKVVFRRRLFDRILLKLLELHAYRHRDTLLLHSMSGFWGPPEIALVTNDPPKYILTNLENLSSNSISRKQESNKAREQFVFLFFCVLFVCAHS